MAHHHESSDSPKTRVLLPKDLVPSKYHLHLTPDLKNFTFKGHVVTDVTVKKSTNLVVLHCLEIKVESVSFTSSNDNATLKAKKIEYQPEAETVTFEFDSPLHVGSGKLDILYEGVLNDKMMGFYRSKYFVNGEERYMATTQFEPTAARRAFPGWDEPAIKAVFEVALTAPKHLQFLSNMDPVHETVEADLKTVRFGASPVMSTYLLAFIVGEFDYVEDHTKEGTRIRVYTPLGKR